MKKTIAVASAALSLVALLSTPVVAQSKPGAGAPRELAFGMISSTGNEDYKKRWKPLLDELGTQTGMRVTATASANIVDDIRDGKVHVAWLSNKLALDAVATGKMKIFAQMVKDDGSSGYSSVLIVARDSPINSPEEIGRAHV